MAMDNAQMENQDMMMMMMSELVAEEKPMMPPSTNTFSSSKGNSTTWANVKPFVNGGAAGILQYSTDVLAHLLALNFHAEITRSPPPAQSYYNAMLKRMPGMLLLQATYVSMQFGSFETLTRKVEASNNRMPLTLYQEACCGLSSGAIAACFSVPMLLAQSRVKAGGNRVSILQDLYRKWADEGVLALWKGGRHRANAVILMSAGMLTPYNRCFNYFRESHGLSKHRSTVGAGLVSGFFASACSIPYIHVCWTMENMQPDANGKYPYSSFPDCAIKILKSRGPRAFFTGYSEHFRRTTAATLMYWICLEAICEYEESVGL